MNSDDEQNDIPDFDWIEGKEKLINIYKNLTKEPQNSIAVTSIYINIDNYIDHIEHSTFETINTSSSNYTIIPYDIIIKSLNTIKNKTKKNYESPKLLLFIVDLLHEQINHFNYNTKDPKQYHNLSFLKEIETYDNIQIPHSLFIFHKINTLYIIYQEAHIEPVCIQTPTIQIVEEYHKPPLTTRNKTKRVSFDVSSTKIKNKHTKKKLYKIIL